MVGAEHKLGHLAPRQLDLVPRPARADLEVAVAEAQGDRLARVDADLLLRWPAMPLISFSTLFTRIIW